MVLVASGSSGSPAAYISNTSFCAVTCDNSTQAGWEALKLMTAAWSVGTFFGAVTPGENRLIAVFKPGTFSQIAFHVGTARGVRESFFYLRTETRTEAVRLLRLIDNAGESKPENVLRWKRDRTRVTIFQKLRDLQPEDEVEARTWISKTIREGGFIPEIDLPMRVTPGSRDVAEVQCTQYAGEHPKPNPSLARVVHIRLTTITPPTELVVTRIRRPVQSGNVFIDFAPETKPQAVADWIVEQLLIAGFAVQI